MDVEPAPSVDLMDKEMPDDSLEHVRLQLKGRLEEAFRSGTLEEAVRKAIDPEAEMDKPPMPEESLDLPGVEGPDEEICGLKMQLRMLLTDAVEHLSRKVKELEEHEGICQLTLGRPLQKNDIKQIQSTSKNNIWKLKFGS